MKKLIGEFRSDVHLRLQTWLTIQLAMFASFTRSIDELKGNRANATPGSSSSRTVQQDTDLGG